MKLEGGVVWFEWEILLRGGILLLGDFMNKVCLRRVNLEGEGRELFGFWYGSRV
jgi:hypothetical protein